VSTATAAGAQVRITPGTPTAAHRPTARRQKTRDAAAADAAARAATQQRHARALVTTRRTRAQDSSTRVPRDHAAKPMLTALTKRGCPRRRRGAASGTRSGCPTRSTRSCCTRRRRRTQWWIPAAARSSGSAKQTRLRKKNDEEKMAACGPTNSSKAAHSAQPVRPAQTSRHSASQCARFVARQRGHTWRGVRRTSMPPRENPLPRMVIMVPPACEPVDGLTLVTTAPCTQTSALHSSAVAMAACTCKPHNSAMNADPTVGSRAHRDTAATRQDPQPTL
jgi:hypothetical protein